MRVPLMAGRIPAWHLPMEMPTEEHYLRLLATYREALQTPAEPQGKKFELLFAQVMRLLRKDSPLNRALPAPLRDVARRYHARERAILDHFGYDENRQFFLSDLQDYLELMRRARTRRVQLPGD